MYNFVFNRDFEGQFDDIGSPKLAQNLMQFHPTGSATVLGSMAHNFVGVKNDDIIRLIDHREQH